MVLHECCRHTSSSQVTSRSWFFPSQVVLSAGGLTWSYFTDSASMRRGKDRITCSGVRRGGDVLRPAEESLEIPVEAQLAGHMHAVTHLPSQLIDVHIQLHTLELHLKQHHAKKSQQLSSCDVRLHADGCLADFPFLTCCHNGMICI